MLRVAGMHVDCDAVLSHSHGGRDRTFVLGPCLDRLVRIAMAIELRVEREREVEVDSSWRARYGISRPREAITVGIRPRLAH